MFDTSLNEEGIVGRAVGMALGRRIAAAQESAMTREELARLQRDPTDITRLRPTLPKDIDMRMAWDGVPTAEAESTMFGVDHCEWGADVAAHWRLGPDLVDVQVDVTDGVFGRILWKADPEVDRQWISDATCCGAENRGIGAMRCAGPHDAGDRPGRLRRRP